MGTVSDGQRRRVAPVSWWGLSILVIAVAAAGGGQIRAEHRAADRVPYGHARTAQQFTVFMPVASALGELDAGTAPRLHTDRAALLRIIAYHTVPVGLPPEAIGGSYRTLAGHALTVTRGARGIEVNDAKVIRGGFRTADATVYVIDRVLTPPSPHPHLPGP
ncbi:fasciclin domain-containing protein [Nocardia sp. CC227C]|uniref:fasciclin domain-containing protein n=1 Tax=Nocardia sp. CC227C TaxID=3044562 RepID=UPI00278BF1FD|nr:fasciclin domain-containing protein [Nocardia sp. CC227C]